MTTNRPVVLSWGMGADSTAILWRWLHDPQSRWFDLADLIVLTAQVGDEFADTHHLGETVVLPALAERGIRLVQVARCGPSERDGIVVLDDTTAPSRLHISGGGWRLSDELRRSATLPQVAASRRICSTKFKGFPLDGWCESNIDGPFDHVLGFNAEEERRAERDTGYSRPGRQSRYPLIEWGWGRLELEAYLLAQTGIAWPRSCCVFCPFAGSSASLPGHLERWVQHPDQAVDALLLEHVSLALNPNMALFGARRAIDEVRSAALTSLLDRFTARLDMVEHAVYEVRRVLPVAADDPTRRAPVWRSVEVLATGSAAAMRELLDRHAAAAHVPVERGDDGIDRVWVSRRGDTWPTTEHLIVAAPAGGISKARPGFDARWATAHTPAMLGAATAR
jgi:hypothetical protein